MCFSFSYAFLQQFKLMGSFEYFNNDVSEKFAGDENAKAEFLNLENSYIVQILGELLLQTIPQMAIQVVNNQNNVAYYETNKRVFIFNPALIRLKASGWNSIAILSFTISCLVLIKDVS